MSEPKLLKRTKRTLGRRNKEWTQQDDVDSLAQGWSIFQCIDFEHPPFELSKYDEMDTFKDDYAAWEFVWAQSKKGDWLARRALRFLHRHSKAEYKEIVEHVTRKEVYGA